jgi:ABC transporter substrate binding protein (PQQ-dependent alcohol dehydrogenase system)
MFVCLLLFFLLAASPSEAKKTAKPKPAQLQTIKIAYLMQTPKVPAALSNLDLFVEDKGIKGAELAIEDNNTTGQYTKQQFSLDKFIVPTDGNVVDEFNKKIAGNYAFVIINLTAVQTNTIADAAAVKNMLVFDAGTTDDALRNEQCRANVFHLLPSRAMRTDALAQYMRKKNWTKWFLVVGATDEDALYAEAVRRSAKKFGMTIVQEKKWEHTFDSRKSAQADVAVFSQIDDDYDVLIVADEQGQFGEYLDYRTWTSRPVIGTQGLVATSWHPTHEQWGATQIQNRFKEKTGRWMTEQDNGAYLAVRAIGEAATRSKSNEMKPINDYLLGDPFALQGYKGVALSFRAWDHQLRQPVLLAAPRSLVAVAPIEGYMHPKTELDTLGFDQPETACTWRKAK